MITIKIIENFPYKEADPRAVGAGAIPGNSPWRGQDLGEFTTSKEQQRSDDPHRGCDGNA